MNQLARNSTREKSTCYGRLTTIAGASNPFNGSHSWKTSCSQDEKPLAIALNVREKRVCKFSNRMELGKGWRAGYRQLKGGRSICLMETIMEGAPNRKSIIGVLSGAYRNVMESITRNRPAPNEALVTTPLLHSYPSPLLERTMTCTSVGKP